MRKKFNATLILGSLSLIAVIYMELSWLRVHIDLERAQIRGKIVSILQEVSQEIVHLVNKKTYFIDPDHTKKNIKSIMRLSLLRSDFRTTLVSASYYLDQRRLQQIFDDKFATAGFSKLKYEFGLMKNDRVSLTSAYNKEKFYSIIHSDVNELYLLHHAVPLKYHQNNRLSIANQKDVEMLHLVVFNDLFFIINKIVYFIVLMVVFTFIVVYIFYKTVAFIIRQERTDIMKTNFINNMTHEFKTPIASIKLATSLINPSMAVERTKDFEEYIALIKEENNRMLTLVETILSNATIARGEIRLDKVVVNLSEIIRETLEPYKVRAQQQHATLLIDTTTAKDKVLIDKIHIRNAFNNIVDNAFKYARPNVSLVLHIKIKNEQPNTVTVFFTDNGMGISKRNLKLVFEKFYRVHTGDMHNVKGFGLGLNYMKSIIEAHRGSIGIASVLGTGTTIKVTLPLHVGKSE